MLRLRDRIDPKRAALLAVGGFLTLALKARKLPGVQTRVQMDRVDPLDDLDADDLFVDDLEAGRGGRHSGGGNGQSSTSSRKSKKPRVHARYGGGNGPPTSKPDGTFDPAPAPWQNGGSMYDVATFGDIDTDVVATMEALIYEELPWNQ